VKALHSRRIDIGLAILLTGSLLLDACGAAAYTNAGDSRQDARMLLLAIHSVALGEEEVEGAQPTPQGTGARARPALRPPAGPIDEVKAAIRDLEADCARERAAIQDTLPEADMGEAVAAVDQICQAELARLQAVLKELRRARDRSWWRRAWVGRALAWTWRTAKKEAPVILLGWATGGGEAAKHLLIERGRRDLQKEARTALGRALARKGIRPELLQLVNLSPGTWPPRGRSSSGRATPDEGDGAGQPTPALDELFTSDSIQLPADGLWTAECTKRPCADCEGEWTWTLSMNLLARSFESHADYTWSTTDTGGWLHTTHLVHEGLGEITEDGMLHGPYHETTTLGFSKGNVIGTPQVNNSDGNMYGVIASDLGAICLSRGEDPGNYDIDYIRRLGREAFFEPDRGCEAECTITQGP
jgi:hypothetical protein